MFSAGLNALGGYQVDGASLSAIASGLYAHHALRRGDLSLLGRYSAISTVKLVTLQLAVINTVAGLYAFATGDRRKESLVTGRYGVFAKDLPPGM